MTQFPWNKAVSPELDDFEIIDALEEAIRNAATNRSEGGAGVPYDFNRACSDIDGAMVAWYVRQWVLWVCACA